MCRNALVLHRLTSLRAGLLANTLGQYTWTSWTDKFESNSSVVESGDLGTMLEPTTTHFKSEPSSVTVQAVLIIDGGIIKDCPWACGYR